MALNFINLVVGLFFLLGFFLAIKNGNNKKLISFSIASAFIVLIILLFVDIMPEVLELLEDSSWVYIIIGVVIGFGILFLLDKLFPHHDHYEEINTHENHLNHIGIMTSIALIIHNIVEGIGIYTVLQNDFKSGLIYALGVGVHNIPFGIQITLMFDNKKEKFKLYTFIGLLTISTFIGGLLLVLFNNLLTSFALGMLLSITVGMIIYLVIFELFIELKESFNKYSMYGLITGLLLMMIGVLL